MSNNKRLLSEIVISIVFSLFLMLLIYGVRPLNIMDVNWIYERGGVIAEQQRCFSQYVQTGYIADTDMKEQLAELVPVFAILFKALSYIVSENIQYMGVYVLVCFFMQCFIGMKIAEHFSKRLLYIIPGGLLLGISPFMLFRVFFNTALSGQFILLLAIYLWVGRGEMAFKSKVLLHVLLGILCMAIHIDFVPLTALLIIGTGIADIAVKREKPINVIMMLTSYAAAVFIGWLCFRSFYEGYMTMGNTAGSCNANLNAFINGYGRSFFMPTLPTAAAGQYEGYCYLGMGWMILLLYSMLLVIENRAGVWVKSYLRFALPVILFIGVVFFVSVQGIFALDDVVIANSYNFSLLGNLAWLLNTNGRYIWIIGYILPVIAMAVIVHIVKNTRHIAILLIVCLIIQCVDMSGYIGAYKMWNETSNNAQITVEQ